MKRKIIGCLVVGLVGLLFSTPAIGQSERNASVVSDLYVISAKAGGVNYTEGKVTVSKNNSRSGYLLRGDRLETGERVSTGPDGRVEILLNPGSYVRLGENTDFEFVSTSLDDLKINLIRGSAMFELIADDEFKVAIQTPKAEFRAIESGVYRVDVLADGSGKISVWEGKAEIGNAAAVTKVKESRYAIVNGSNVTVEKFDRDDKSELEIWSKARAKELAKINSKLRRDDIRNSLLNSFNRRGWGFYDSFGLWVFDRFSGQYCFVPFGYGWGSPYGYYFGRDLWYFRLPRYVYYYPTGNPGSSNGSNNTSSNPRIRGGRNKKPPFARVNPGGNRQPRSSPSDITPMPRRSITPPLSIPGTPTPRTSTKGKPNN